ncbi:MAG: polyphosphate glucokinase [Anaerolineaceae bacterium]|nr:polyphosphate glucokinase [Anaerolineaceae bacterium]
MEILGIDIGGSGIKGAPVDTDKGELSADRHRIPTPQPSTPEAVVNVVAQIVEHFEWNGLIGCTFPAIIKNGVTHSAANVDNAWIGFEAEKMLRQQTGCSLLLINDADAAGIAEMKFGAGREAEGVTIVLTLGTGIGSAIFVDGELLPNTELGHLEIKGKEAEKWTADSIRKKKDLAWNEWGERLNTYLSHLEFLFSPDLIILGGGVSKKFNKYESYLTTHAPCVPAKLRNEAGIVGAAMAAQRMAH